MSISPFTLAPPAGAASLSAPPELEARVTALWARHQAAAGRQRRARKELARLRAELGAQLAAVKDRLAGASPRGAWGAWIEARGIPRATADRLVARHHHPDPEPPPALAAGPLPADLQPALAGVLELLRPFSLRDRFRCLEALGPALDLVCRHRGCYADLLIQAPPAEDDEELDEDEGDADDDADEAEDGDEEDEEDDEDEEEEEDDEEDRDDESEDAPAAAGTAPVAKAAAAAIAPAARRDTPAAIDSPVASSSLRNFWRRARRLALPSPAANHRQARPLRAGWLAVTPAKKMAG